MCLDREMKNDQTHIRQELDNNRTGLKYLARTPSRIPISFYRLVLRLERV